MTQDRECSMVRLVRGNIELNPVAGRENDRFANRLVRSQLLQDIRNFRFGESEPFPHLDGRRVVTKSNDDDGHCYEPRSVERGRRFAAGLRLASRISARSTQVPEAPWLRLF